MHEADPVRGACAGQHLPHWHLRASELLFLIEARMLGHAMSRALAQLSDGPQVFDI